MARKSQKAIEDLQMSYSIISNAEKRIVIEHLSGVKAFESKKGNVCFRADNKQSIVTLSELPDELCKKIVVGMLYHGGNSQFAVLNYVGYAFDSEKSYKDSITVKPAVKEDDGIDLNDALKRTAGYRAKKSKKEDEE